MLPGLAPKAADLVGAGGWREAAAEVFVEEQVHAVALDNCASVGADWLGHRYPEGTVARHAVTVPSLHALSHNAPLSYDW